MRPVIVVDAKDMIYTRYAVHPTWQCTPYRSQQPLDQDEVEWLRTSPPSVVQSSMK